MDLSSRQFHERTELLVKDMIESSQKVSKSYFGEYKRNTRFLSGDWVLPKPNPLRKEGNVSPQDD